MTSLINRRVRIASLTIVALIIAAVLSAPASVLSMVVGGNDHGLLPAAPTFQFASREARHAANHSATPGQSDSVDARLEAGSRSAIESVEHHVEDLLGDVLIDDPLVDLARIPDSIDDGGLLGGFDFPQDGHLPPFAADNGALGFPRGGLPFLAGGGFGAARGGSGATGGGGSAASGAGSGAVNGGPGAEDSNHGGSSPSDSTGSSAQNGSGNGEGSRGTTPDASELGTREDGAPGIEVLPKIEDGEIGGGPIDPVPVPEPTPLVLTGLGLAGLVARHRRASRAVRQASQAQSTIAETHAANRP